MEKKQTAVEWLDERFLKYTNWIEGDPRATEYTLTELFNDFEQAKEMEKEQIIDAFYQCGKDNFEHIKIINRSAVEYYNETYGTKNN